MKATRLALLLGAVLVGASCHSFEGGGPFSPGEQRELARARALWQSRAMASYTFEVRILCFCPPEIVRWSEVDVRNGTVVAVRALEPPFDSPSLALTYWPTVESLFKVPEQAASGGYLEKVTATYDSELGYPRKIDVVCKQNVADCGSTHEARNLRPLAAVRR